MEGETQPIFEQLASLWGAVSAKFGTLFLFRGQVQFAILTGCLVLAWVLHRLIAPRMHDWMRTLGRRPKWQMRFLVLLHKRLLLLIFALLVWGAAGVVAMVSPFPSWRNILELAATIATAWLVVSLASRLVRNRFLRRIVTWGLWIYVTLYYLGVTDDFAAFLNGIGFEIGDFRLSLLILIKAFVVTALLLVVARLTTTTVASRIEHNKDISPSMRVLFIKFLQVLVYGAALFLGLKAIGFDLTGLAFLSGAIGLGLGFGLQKVVSNLVSGIIILLDKSIKPGDVISLGDTFGWINTLGARYASVVTRDGREYLIPNEDLITNQVVNWSHTNDFVRLDIRFGTSYHDDPHQVRALACRAAASVDRVLSSRPPVCHVTGFGDSSVDYVLRFWINDPTSGLTNVRGAVYLALWDAFRENGVTIPFPQREVRMLEGSEMTVRRENG